MRRGPLAKFQRWLVWTAYWALAVALWVAITIAVYYGTGQEP